MNVQRLKQLALEAARLAVIATVTYLTTDLVISNIVDALVGTSLSPEIKLQITGLITVIIKGYDRALHETAEKGSTQEKGLLRF